MTIQHRRACGFTLIEVMIVVAIIAILAAVAYPAYTEQVARSRRADAKGALLERAQWLERLFSVTGTYAKLADGSTVTASSLPALDSRTATYYTLTLPSGDLKTSSFTLQMVNKGAMSSDKCGTFSITNTGARTPTSPADCWGK